MYEHITLKTLKILKSLNEKRNKFNKMNEDFFLQYDNSNFLEKYLLRKNVLLISKEETNEYIGFFWYTEEIETISINSLFIDSPAKERTSYYKYILNNIFGYKYVTFDFLGDSEELNCLTNSGFIIKNTRFKMVNKISNFHILSLPEDISFKTFERGKDEEKRCIIQNDVFKNKWRTPLKIKDIYLDESQSYYFNEGSIFIMKDDFPIGYGQIILDDSTATIVNFGVLKTYRNNGYGELLLKYLLNIAKLFNHNEVFLNVDLYNNEAISLYKKVGFTYVDESYMLIKEYIK